MGNRVYKLVPNEKVQQATMLVNEWIGPNRIGETEDFLMSPLVTKFCSNNEKRKNVKLIRVQFDLLRVVSQWSPLIQGQREQNVVENQRKRTFSNVAVFQ